MSCLECRRAFTLRALRRIIIDMDKNTLELLVAGTGIGLLFGALLAKLFSLEWLAVSVGAILLILSGVSMSIQKSKQ